MCRIHETRTTSPTEQETRGGHEMRELTLTCLRTTRFRRRSTGARRHIRRIAHDEIRFAAMRFRGRHHVVLDDERFRGDPILFEILRAKARSVAIDLDERHVRRVSRAKHRDADRTGSRAEIERSTRDFFRPRKARKMERVDIGAIPCATRRLKRQFQKTLIFARDDDRGTKVR
jgi:hypothetical protein